jgi:transposase
MRLGGVKVSAALRARRQIGFPHRQIAKRLGIGRASVYRIIAA